MWQLGTWFSGGLGCAGWMVGLSDGGFSNFLHDSMINSMINSMSHAQVLLHKLLGGPGLARPLSPPGQVTRCHVRPNGHGVRGPRSHVCTWCRAQGDLGGYFGQVSAWALLSGNRLINNTIMQWVQEPPRLRAHPCPRSGGRSVPGGTSPQGLPWDALAELEVPWGITGCCPTQRDPGRSNRVNPFGELTARVAVLESASSVFPHFVSCFCCATAPSLALGAGRDGGMQHSWGWDALTKLEVLWGFMGCCPMQRDPDRFSRVNPFGETLLTARGAVLESVHLRDERVLNCFPTFCLLFLLCHSSIPGSGSWQGWRGTAQQGMCVWGTRSLSNMEQVSRYLRGGLNMCEWAP
ncbi:uncharacterized protein LOC127060464 [Serinus canaria]|uniref:uncharacterized protein LOC127060464 n=1 Tax=Serinus canaria TaxID=9135 RepID=UPI0021CC6270|nr:uncharacterized protein LOC127060464 [Serinus canaria]